MPANPPRIRPRFSSAVQGPGGGGAFFIPNQLQLLKGETRNVTVDLSLILGSTEVLTPPLSVLLSDNTNNSIVPAIANNSPTTPSSQSIGFSISSDVLVVEHDYTLLASALSVSILGTISSGPYSNGLGYSSILVTALARPIYIGTVIRIYNFATNKSNDVTLTANYAAGYVGSITVQTFTCVTDYGAGTPITVVSSPQQASLSPTRVITAQLQVQVNKN